MRILKPLFDNNQKWAARMLARDPQFFERLAAQQSPQFFWIGCSDSRVPANQYCKAAEQGDARAQNNSGTIIDKRFVPMLQEGGVYVVLFS